MAAANKTTTPPRTLREIVSNEEGAFREVKVRAWLLCDRLNETIPVEAQEQECLALIASDLMGLGNRIDGIFEELFEIGKSQPES